MNLSLSLSGGISKSWIFSQYRDLGGSYPDRCSLKLSPTLPCLTHGYCPLSFLTIPFQSIHPRLLVALVSEHACPNIRHWRSQEIIRDTCATWHVFQQKNRKGNCERIGKICYPPLDHVPVNFFRFCLQSLSDRQQQFSSYKYGSRRKATWKDCGVLYMIVMILMEHWIWCARNLDRLWLK